MACPRGDCRSQARRASVDSDEEQLIVTCTPHLFCESVLLLPMEKVRGCIHPSVRTYTHEINRAVVYSLACRTPFRSDMTSPLPIPAERIERMILLLRDHKVMIDSHLAALYGVSTKRLNEQVRRNRDRFPEDFMFQLTSEEASLLRSQNATSKSKGGRRYSPYAFTEQGVAMLSSVLKSKHPIQKPIIPAETVYKTL